MRSRKDPLHAFDRCQDLSRPIGYRLPCRSAIVLSAVLAVAALPKMSSHSPAALMYYQADCRLVAGYGAAVPVRASRVRSLLNRTKLSPSWRTLDPQHLLSVMP